MNTTLRALTALALIGSLAACAPASDPGAPSSAPAASTDVATSAEPMATDPPSAEPSPTASEEASASHDMGDMGGSGETVTVDIANFAFDPIELTISAGTEVVFTNSDAAPHTVTAGTDAAPTPERFDSGLLQTGDEFRFLFEEPGEYAYFCERHPPMTGRIVVEP